MPAKQPFVWKRTSSSIHSFNVNDLRQRFLHFLCVCQGKVRAACQRLIIKRFGWRKVTNAYSAIFRKTEISETENRQRERVKCKKSHPEMAGWAILTRFLDAEQRHTLKKPIWLAISLKSRRLTMRPYFRMSPRRLPDVRHLLPPLPLPTTCLLLLQTMICIK